MTTWGAKKLLVVSEQFPINVPVNIPVNSMSGGIDPICRKRPITGSNGSGTGVISEA